VHSLQDFAAEKVAGLEARRLRRTLAETTRTDGLWVERDGRRLLSFSCNDYLNLTHHAAVKAAAIAAVETYGAGAGASRLVTGNYPLLARLEEQLARLKGTDAACVFGSGYLANLGIIPSLVGPGDLVAVDELAHACIRAGAKLSGAEGVVFRHNDVAHLEALLRERRQRHRHALVATDGVFSMDGDLAPLDLLSDVCRAWDAWLLNDDAHGLGVVGQGRGAVRAFEGRADVPLQMGTLSKAVGAYGGYLCASKPVVDFIKTRARTLIYSTGLPPAAAAAALAALDLIESDERLTAAPLAKARAFTRAAGLPEATSAVVPVIVGEAGAALDASRLLEGKGFLVVAIRPPTVPEGTARLRFAFTAGHPEDEVARLADLIRTRILGR
jgi:8-amino-7-oxononanoate synthase